jgi:acyl dehydratase
VPLRREAIGVETDLGVRTWSSTDAILYALGVGAGPDDLAFTTENTADTPQAVLPTFGVVLAASGRSAEWGTFDRARMVHGEQSIALHRPIPPHGTARAVSVVTDILDKGTGALVVSETRVTDAETGAPLVTGRSGVFLRGEKGFGAGAPTPPWEVPARPPDQVRVLATRPDQALLYRLSGDRNPLHSDPAFARRAGFDRPILHGLCTFGFAGRALLATLCDGDPARFAAMEARFTRPVLPGDSLVVQVWVDGEARFRVTTQDGRVVLDRGRAAVR